MRIAFNQADSKFNEVVEHYKNNLGSLRVGRGSLQMIEAMRAEVYGQSMPLNQIASISMVDPTLITVSPWDKNNVSAIIKAVQSSDLGINPNQDGDTIKLPIPPLTEERRVEYVKVLHTKAEEARVAIRQIRKELMETIEEDKKNAVIGEDEMLRLEKEVQKKVDHANQTVDQIAKDKEKELMQV
jgi:ribosome recycling factor